jgi:inhibitor of cysteine peptidase
MWWINLIILAIFQTTPSMIPEHDTIRAKVGEKFEVKLPGNIATGYSWALAAPVDSQLITLDRQFYADAVSKIDGNPGMDVFLFKALKEGNTTLDFFYRRPFDRQIPTDAKREHFNVLID